MWIPLKVALKKRSAPRKVTFMNRNENPPLIQSEDVAVFMALDVLINVSSAQILPTIKTMIRYFMDRVPFDV